MASQIATLKAKHAEHLLRVVREAEKQEAVRQRKLRHATSNANFTYLQKRFNAERRKDQEHISGLVEDANTVEAALIRGSQNSEEKSWQTGNGRPQRDRSVNVGGNSGPYRGEGDAGIAGGTNGGRSSIGGSIGTTPTKSNAYVEPSETREDPNFISLNQMRFMKHVHARLDGQKAARAHTRLMTQPVGAKNTADKPGKRHRRSGDSGKEPSPRKRVGSKMVDGALAGSSTLPFMGTVEGCATGSTAAQQLLERKRSILLEMKGVVGRQAEAVDRLVASSANNRVTKRGVCGDYSSSRRRSRSLQESKGSSPTPCCILHERRKSDRCSRVGSASCVDASNLVVQNSPAMPSPFTAGVKAALPLPPPRPPENDTSAFLARGGRWGGESRHGASSTRDSLASVSSASYATYCKRDLEGGRATRGVVGRRPGIVPALPV
ncbi:unnamed protein product [Pylaiella littoralis]